MDEVVDPFGAGLAVPDCYLPYSSRQDADGEGRRSVPRHGDDDAADDAHDAHDGRARPDGGPRGVGGSLSTSSDGTADKGADEAPKRPGISRSTYFRAKRNLKSHGSVRSTATGKQIGRPQKLDSNAEKLIRAELGRNPSAELKQLQALVLEQCDIQVSLSSISRRLKALGCSPSMNGGQLKRVRRKAGEDAATLGDHNPSVPFDAMSAQHEQDLGDFDPMHHHLGSYDDMRRAFGGGIDDADLSAYDESPDMHLDMLEMQNGYAGLGDDIGDDIGDDGDHGHLYKYDNFEKVDGLHDFSPTLDQDMYEHAEHQRQLLFNDPNLSVSSTGWQEV